MPAHRSKELYQATTQANLDLSDTSSEEEPLMQFDLYPKPEI